MDTLLCFCKKHYFFSPILAAASLGLVSSLVYLGFSLPRTLILLALYTTALLWVAFSALLFYPLILTGMEVFFLFRKPENVQTGPTWVTDFMAVFLGVVYSLCDLVFIHGADFSANWTDQLANDATHTPVATQYAPVLVVFLLLGIVGYCLLNCIPLDHLPPLVILFGVSGMYLACALTVVWCVQVCNDFPGSLYLLLLAAPVFLITARTVRRSMWVWNRLQREEKTYSTPFVNALARLLRRSALWPVLGLVLALPLLGVVLALMALLGQEPSAAIKAFTETSDWNLSQRIAPQNVYYDEHYLCTAAAGGHRRVVRPKRLGVRHGHQVIVNRQLCVANAFEQVLEERTPRLHRTVRGFYDRYGFPLARHIRSKWAADLVYLAMKPLEWCFLLVLYLTDSRPEDRIALQYTGKSLQDFPVED